jgi:hypothetical protein
VGGLPAPLTRAPIPFAAAVGVRISV